MKDSNENIIEKTLFEKIALSSYIGTSRVIITFGAGHPFDLVKTRMQANPNIQSGVLLTKKIFEETGVRGFYTGGVPNFTRTFLKESYRSPIRGASKSFFNQNLPDSLNSKESVNLLTSLTMATTDTFIVCPLERLKVWMMTNYTKNKGVTHFFNRLKNHNPTEIAGELFRGLNASFVRSGMSWASYLLAEEKIYQAVKNISPRVNREDNSLPLPEQILVGSLSGAINCLATLPFDSAKTQIQKEGALNTKSMFSAMRNIYQEFGVKGLYTGWQARLPHYVVVGILTSHVIQEVDKIWGVNRR